MRRVLALALIGAAGYAGWRYWRAGGLGGAPSAGASLGAIEAYQPGELQAELDEERARGALGDLIGRGLGDPFAGAEVLAQVPVSDLSAQVAALAEANRATLDDGIRTTGRSTRADRELLAEAECRRASATAGLPSWLIDDCTRTLTTSNAFTYAPPGGRAQLRVDIGLGGLYGDPPATITPTALNPVTGRPRPPTI